MQNIDNDHILKDAHGVLLLQDNSDPNPCVQTLTDALRNRGFAVLHVNPLLHFWQEWLDAAKESFLSLAARSDCISLAGFGLGGCMALLLAEQMYPAAVMIMDAPMSMSGIRRVSPSQAACARRIITMARQDLHAVTCPVLAVQTSEDAKDPAEVILRGVSSEHKGLLQLADVQAGIIPNRIAEAAAGLFRQSEKNLK